MESSSMQEETNAQNTAGLPSHKSALVIFTRNPELGKVKTRLAVTVGDESALEIYKFLLKHTASITQKLPVDKYVFYSEKVRENDIWSEHVYRKKAQQGTDLGARMLDAFEGLFSVGYEKVIIIGSDMYDLGERDLSNAFTALDSAEVVLGPATDGGYYLLGMKQLLPKLFKEKDWGTDTVLKATLADLNNKKLTLLDERNDIDYFSDIRHLEALQHLLPDHLDNTFR
ncbi:TIGR04282 family arsenosugar biosynthesis glycosyltransferase [Altibacter sp. HG106]|uniref:TIGR04282 family arsenosugar biosynthesis glycosyltransferase n=1 Tax=Altibacter sp. HG106 TaxID=3023937 RepID=UPI00234FD79C|nr:TIGR04282 family arsenosugar biosynthesis glycosyltransferase [Altibacter sp. HG106]MDC7994238.1 TIGR04282 family arsenosugar biosynthesis glycosyltransferase [Altibacter sp. HG106]